MLSIYEKPVCEFSLIGPNGNAFVLIGGTIRCLCDAGLEQEAKEFELKAFNECRNYTEVLNLMKDYVEVKWDAEEVEK